MGKIIKIGELNYGKFKTEFKIMKKTKNYIDNEKISLACLIPDAWRFYEAFLFDFIYGENVDGKIDKKIGKNFVVVYNKITESLGWTKEKGLETTGFEEKFKFKKSGYVLNSGIKLVSVKNPKKEFLANYVVIKK